MSTASLPTPALETPHHALPIRGCLFRYSISYRDPLGSPQALSITSTWQPDADQARRLWENLCRGLVQTGCTVEGVTAYRETVVEL